MKTSIFFDVRWQDRQGSHYLIYKLGRQADGRDLSFFPGTNSVCG